MPARRMPLLALFSANAISLTGSALTLIAVPWFVLQTTGSPAKTGVTAFCEFAATVLAAFFGGALVDRIGHRRASIAADLSSGGAIALIPALYYTVGLAFWQLLALVFCAAFFNAPGTTARSALVPDLAGLAGMRLERANSVVQSIQRGAMMLGAPLAGVLIAVLGTSRLLWIDAATFAVSALLVGFAVRAPAPATSGAEPPSRYLADLRAGLRYIFGEPVVRVIVLTVMVTNFLDAPFVSVIMPVFARDLYHSAVVFGLTVSVFGGGSLLGAILYGVAGHRLPRRPIYIALFIFAGTRFWVLALFPTLPIVLGTLALDGLASGPINPIIGTVLQERVPASMRGRVFGAVTASAWSAMPIGVLGAGYLLVAIGLRAVLLICAALYLVTTISLLFSRGLRQMDASAAAPPSSEPIPADEREAAQSGR
jgi:MFS family permease